MGKLTIKTMKDYFMNCDYWYCPDIEEQTTDIKTMENWTKEGLPIMAVHSELLITDSQGIYIPQIFFNNFDFKEWGLNKDDYVDLDKPNSETYWDTWSDLLMRAEMLDKESGASWYLEQDGDLFARMNY